MYDYVHNDNGKPKIWVKNKEMGKFIRNLHF